eukprot:TRINITY_DN11783_c0_g1_i1.p2 TRINITY_DN11783_c0_g1~~TRINITY_DN11783_c0_g1_i1.p2  ORF type:complete len:196 (-),score=15.99 TRINITY_DN11783_c0_g1_i1:42-629(-)
MQIVLNYQQGQDLKKMAMPVAKKVHPYPFESKFQKENRLIITIRQACHTPLKIENQNFEVLNKVDLNPSSQQLASNSSKLREAFIGFKKVSDGNSSSINEQTTIGKEVQKILNNQYKQESKIICPENQVQKDIQNTGRTYTIFLQKLQQIKQEFFRQLSRPTQSINLRIILNSPIAQSEALAAYQPSTPLIPIPT